MKKFLNKPYLIGFLIALAYFCLNLSVINDYGVTWDFTYHFNAGLWHLNKPLTDPNFAIYPWGPLGDICPTLSLLIFSDKLPLFFWDTAYNLYSILLGSLGIGLLYIII